MFILPVCIDGTTEAEAQVPDKFKAVHFLRLPAGDVTPEFVRRVRELFAAKPR